jgi:serine/threonine protein phosphatase PrpC/CRP-like cAMP-binding protein
MRKGQLEQRRKMIKHESMKSAPSNNNNDGGANTTSGGGGSGVIKAETIQLNKEMTQHACATAHKQCNLAMHGHPHVDDTLSGTTSITCYIHGDRNKVTVCNVGDSRAVLGKRMNRESYSASAVGNGDGKEKYYKALPLSRDQTPYRRDERKRIRKYGAGARILSLDQIEGLEPILADIDDDENDDAVYGKNDKELGKEIDEDGDPPRIWHPEQDYPGTAFTRSLGDAFAEELGVFAEPEMLTRELEEGDEIIVLASDGVFEFLTNQSVIDICAKFKDPLSACKAVIAESYELWLQYELRTDDITMICIFIESNEAKSSVKDTNEKDDLLMTLQRESKPVRLRPSVEKSQLLRELSKKTLFDDNNEVDISKLYTEKTEQEKEIIAQAIKSCVMLQSITDDQRETIYGVMEPVEVSKGDWIIRQGTVGDKWFIVESGTFEVRILQKNKDDPLNTGGTLVHEYQGALETHTHPSFGEHALLYSVPRAASIIAQTDGKLWALHKSAWRKVLVERSGRQDLIKILRTINVLKIFNLEEIEYIAGTMKIESFAKDYTITRTSMPGDALYIISNGQCGKWRYWFYSYLFLI